MFGKHSYIFSLHSVDVNAVLGISFPQHCQYCDPAFNLSPRVLSYVRYKRLTERFEVKTKELVFAQLSGGKRCASAG